MDFLWTFLEGFASFVSPCTLPLMPVFAAYFAGDKGRGGFLKALAFVLGFTCVFMSLGLFAASIGGFFSAHRTAISVVSGIIVILFGLVFLDIIRLPGFKGATGMNEKRGIFGAFLFGFIYSVNLTPCVGAFLAAALATAADSGTWWKGAALLGTYSAGLGIPFIVAGIMLSKLNGLFGKIKSHYNVLVPVCGAALILFGAWMIAKPFVHFKSEEPTTQEETKMEVIDITSKEMYESEVLKSDKPVIVDFWATWCGPCKAMGPVLAEVAAERSDIKVCKVNVDDLGDIAAQYGITAIPCMILIKEGKPAAQSVGYVSKQALLSALGL